MVCICFLGFVNLMGVGSVNDWSTVYFSTILHTTPFYTGMGYAFFITFQILGQVASDWFIVQYGPRNMLTYSGACLSLTIILFYFPSNFTFSFWLISLYLSLSVYLSVHLSLSISVYFWILPPLYLFQGILAFCGMGCVVCAPSFNWSYINPYGPFLLAVGGEWFHSIQYHFFPFILHTKS